MQSQPPVVGLAPSPDGRRRIVRLIRYGLAATALIIVLLVLLWPEIRSNQARMQISGQPAEVPGAPGSPVGGLAPVAGPGRDTAFNAVFDGVDRYGRPFRVTSPRAETAEAKDSTLDLAQPVADMTLSDGRRVRVTADKGLYDPNSRTVDLWGNVVFVDETGYRAETSEARVFLDDASITGPKPVVGSASFGEIDGSAFRLTDAGAKVFVHGPATMRITQTAPRIQ
jgi:hypothetical protein